MWSSRIVGSRDPDEFVTLIRPSGCDILVTERGPFKARGILMEIDRLYLQRRSERLARLIQVAMPRPGMLFLTEAGPSMFWDGVEIGQDNLALFSSGETYLSRLSGPTSWGALSLADDDMEAICGLSSGGPAIWSNGCTVITPPPLALADLRALHAAAGDLADAFPKLSIDPEITRTMERALIDAMVACIQTPGNRSDTAAMQHHRLIIRRFHEMLDANPLEPLHMPQTSHAIGVSGRTLRMACQKQFGVSPTQYLLLCRMRLARRSLQQADPTITRVTDVATELGFWELGRFSVKYRQIFGETPSTTLRAENLPRQRDVAPAYALA
jgi:AraC-like DNA-binding protein